MITHTYVYIYMYIIKQDNFFRTSDFTCIPPGALIPLAGLFADPSEENVLILHWRVHCRGLRRND